MLVSGIVCFLVEVLFLANLGYYISPSVETHIMPYSSFIG